MLFRCNTCRRTYRDYQPIDDTCAKCGKGLVRFVPAPEAKRPEKNKSVLPKTRLDKMNYFV